MCLCVCVCVIYDRIHVELSVFRLEFERQQREELEKLESKRYNNIYRIIMDHVSNISCIEYIMYRI